MSMGMLFAGALTGGANALGQLADQAIKREDDDRRRAQSIMDRRNELLFEMKAKADLARQEEERASRGFERAAERGAEIGNERAARELEAARASVPNEGEFASERITPEMIAAMPPQARAIYERDMGVTPLSSLQSLKDQVQASGEVGAPAAVRKGLLESYRDAFKEDKAEKDYKLRLEQEDRRDRRAAEQLESRERIAEAANAARERAAEARMNAALEAASIRASGRGGPAGLDQTERLTVLKDVKAKADATRPKAPTDGRSSSRRAYEAELAAWKESDDGQTSAMVAKRIRTLIERGEAMGESADTSLPSDAAMGPASTPATRAQADVDGIKRERDRVAKDKSPATVDRLGILDDELKKAEARLKAARAAEARPAAASAPTTSAATPPAGATLQGRDRASGRLVYRLNDGRLVMAN